MVCFCLTSFCLKLHWVYAWSPEQGFYWPRSRGNNMFGSVCVSICLSVGTLLFEPFHLWSWFLAEGQPWLWLAWIVGQGCRSKVKVKQWKLVTLSHLNQWCRAGRYQDSACRVQPMVIANDHYQSTGIVCLSVIRRRSTCRAQAVDQL